MKKPIIGDKVWLKASAIGQPQKMLEIEERFITGVGRIYFTISGTYGRRRFKIADGREDNDLNSYWKVYFDKRLLEEEQEYKEKNTACEAFFSTWRKVKPDLEQLRAIYNILYAVRPEEKAINYLSAAPKCLCCANCKNWTPPNPHNPEWDQEGDCSAIPAAGGAWHTAGTYADFFCSEFIHKEDPACVHKYGVNGICEFCKQDAGFNYSPSNNVK